MERRYPGAGNMSKQFISLIFFMTIITAMKPNTAKGSLEYIRNNDLLGIQVDTISIPAIDTFVINKIVALKKAETGEIFNCNPRIYSNMKFTELPGILLYSLFVCDPAGLHYRDPFSFVLIDTSNNYIYHFNGEIKSFNNLIKAHLPKEMTPYFAQDLIKFYMATLNARYDYNMLNSYSDFEAFYYQMHPFLLSDREIVKDEPFHKKLLADLDTAKSIINNLKMTKKAASYLFEFDCANWYDRFLEHWIVEVSPSGLKIKERRILLRDLGLPVARL
jgi:hypothetical protein